MRVFCSESVSRASKEKFLTILAELSCQVLVRHQRVLFIIVGVVRCQITPVHDCWNHRSRVPHPLLPCKLLIALLCVLSGEELDLISVTITGTRAEVS